MSKISLELFILFFLSGLNLGDDIGQLLDLLFGFQMVLLIFFLDLARSKLSQNSVELTVEVDLVSHVLEVVRDSFVVFLLLYEV